MALWTIENSVIIGACRSWEGKSVFARAPLLVSEHTFEKKYLGKILRVTKYPDPDHVKGDELNFEECDALVTQGEALQFDCIVPLRKAGTVCWIMRLDSYTEASRPDWIFSKLIHSDALLFLPIRGPKSFTFALMVDELKANYIRDVWAREEIHKAKNWACDWKAWKEAAEHAERANIISLDPNPYISAQVVFYLEKAGNLVRSQGYLQMLKNSNDADFIANVEQHIKQLHEMYK